MDTTISNNFFTFPPNIISNDESNRLNRTGFLHSDHVGQRYHLSDGLPNTSTTTLQHAELLGQPLPDPSLYTNFESDGMVTDVLATDNVHASLVPIAMDTSEPIECNPRFLHVKPSIDRQHNFQNNR